MIKLKFIVKSRQNYILQNVVSATTLAHVGKNVHAVCARIPQTAGIQAGIRNPEMEIRNPGNHNLDRSSVFPSSQFAYGLVLDALKLSRI